MHAHELDESTLRDVIRSFVCDQVTNIGPTVRRRKALAHCFRGNVRFKGNLWVVFQFEITDSNGHVSLLPPAIYVIVLQRSGTKWTYRYYAEEEGPYEYNCPVSYLELAPETDIGWRYLVHRWAAARAFRRKHSKRYVS